MKSPCSPLVGFLLGSLALPAGADVLNVRGPAPDFPQIASAVAAASDGDVLRIWPGTYDPFTVLDKDLDLVRAVGGGAVQVDGSIRIQGLSAFKTVSLAGLDAEGVDQAGLIVQGCAGRVRVRDGAFTGAGEITNGSAFSGLWVQGCADVLITDCQITAGVWASYETDWWGLDGVFVQDSVLSLFDCSVTAGNGITRDDPGGSGGNGGHGVAAYGSGRLFVAGGNYVAGHGANADHDPSVWTGQYGTGGYGGYGLYGDMETWERGADLQPGFGGWSPGTSGENGEEIEQGTRLGGVPSLLRVTALASGGQPLELDLSGPAAASVWVAGHPRAGYAFDPFRGPLLIGGPGGMNARAWRWVGSTDAAGDLSTSWPSRSLAPGEHATVQWQAIVVAGATRRSGVSWTVLVGD